MRCVRCDKPCRCSIWTRPFVSCSCNASHAPHRTHRLERIRIFYRSLNMLRIEIYDIRFPWPPLSNTIPNVSPVWIGYSEVSVKPSLSPQCPTTGRTRRQHYNFWPGISLNTYQNLKFRPILFSSSCVPSCIKIGWTVAEKSWPELNEWKGRKIQTKTKGRFLSTYFS